MALSKNGIKMDNYSYRDISKMVKNMDFGKYGVKMDNNGVSAN
jgi:hypothetical protein